MNEHIVHTDRGVSSSLLFFHHCPPSLPFHLITLYPHHLTSAFYQLGRWATRRQTRKQAGREVAVSGFGLCYHTGIFYLLGRFARCPFGDVLRFLSSVIIDDDKFVFSSYLPFPRYPFLVPKRRSEYISSFRF